MSLVVNCLVDLPRRNIQLRVTIWSLTDGTATYIQFPKHSDRGEYFGQNLIDYALISLGYTFRKDDRYFVLAERHKSRDTIGVYDARDGYKAARVSPMFAICNPYDLYGQHSISSPQLSRWLPWRYRRTGGTLQYGKDLLKCVRIIKLSCTFVYNRTVQALDP